MRSWETSRRICPCRNVFVALIKYTAYCIFIQAQSATCQTYSRKIYRCRVRLRRGEHKRGETGPGDRQAAERGSYFIRRSIQMIAGFSALRMLPISNQPFLAMSDNCHIAGCKHDVPAALAELKLCILHFTLSLEASCAEMRRETALGNTPQDRQREIMKFITGNGESLARVATSGLHLTDDLKARVLSTFLTLMNLRENLDRASMRTPAGRSGIFR